MNSKRIITAILSTVVTVGVIAGIVAAVKSTTSTKQVMVVPASELNFGYGYDGENAVEGYVTSSAAQNVYIQEDVIVREIKVTDGQQVKKGDVLIVTDPGQAELNLAKAKLNQEQIKLYIDTAQKNIKTLKNIKPSGNASPTIPDVTDATDVPVDPLETLPGRRLCIRIPTATPPTRARRVRIREWNWDVWTLITARLYPCSLVTFRLSAYSLLIIRRMTSFASSFSTP